MAYKSGFFDAVDTGEGVYDRVYDASEFSHYFSLFIKNGVFPNPSTGLQVTASASPDLYVAVNPGDGWINGYYVSVLENSPEALKISTANPSLSRIDSVVMGLDLSAREIELYIKTGAVSANPTPVTLQRDNDVYELELAQISIPAGTASITQSLIKDMRSNTTRCGIVSGTVEQIDTTGLFAQYDDAFTTWFDSIKGHLAEDPATALQAQIDEIVSKLTPEGIGAAPAVESADYPGCYYRTVNGAIEWINPPMVGVEYRTTERFAGSPVYVKNVNIGYLPNASNNYINGVLPADAKIISIDGYGEAADGEVQPLLSLVDEVWTVAKNGYIGVKTSADRSGHTAVIIIKYTKD